MWRRWQQRRLAAVVAFVLILAPVVAGDGPCAPGVFWQPSQEVLTLGQHGLWTMQFAAPTGGLLELNSSNAVVSHGSRGSELWGATFSDGSYVGSSGFNGNFTWAWSEPQCTLSMMWAPHRSSADPCLPGATATFAVAPSGPDFSAAPVDSQLRLTLPAKCNKTMNYVLWLSDLLLDYNRTSEVLLPWLPGLVLTNRFLRENRTFSLPYPGKGLFSDFLAWRVQPQSPQTSMHPAIMLHALREPEDPTSSVVVQLSASAGPDNTYFHHAYGSEVRGGGEYVTPRYRMSFDPDGNFSRMVHRFAASMRFDEYPTLRQKLGGRYEAFASRALLKMDANEIGSPFSEYESLLGEAVDVPVLVHPCGFEPHGFDRFYPDLLPPAKQWGSTADLATFVAAAREAGHLVVPCTLHPIARRLLAIPGLAAGRRSRSWWPFGFDALVNFPQFRSRFLPR